MTIHSFQQQIATGRFNLPVAILVSILLWTLHGTLWTEIASFLLMAFTGYIMIETNTAYSLIRTRTTLPTCFFGCMMSTFFFLHPFQLQLAATPLWLMSVFELFRSYEANEPQAITFNSFLFLSIGSWIFPPLLYLLPLWYLGLVYFRSFSGKSFMASLLGLLTPYWFMLGYSLYTDDPFFWDSPIKEIIQWDSISYTTWTLPMILCIAFSTVQLFIGFIHYQKVSYLDKNKTRILLSFISLMGLWITAFLFLQPEDACYWLPMQLTITSLLTGHLFTLTINRFTGIYFIVNFVCYNLLTLYLLWTQLFSF